jgi:hypothetical protein
MDTPCKRRNQKHDSEPQKTGDWKKIQDGEAEKIGLPITGEVGGRDP